MKSAEEIKRSEKLIQWLDSKIDGLEIPSNDRCRIGAGCLDMALEHQKAIVTLSAKLLHGSAAALVRLQFEAYVRGVWILYCAAEEQIERFKEDKLDRKFRDLIEDIEKLEVYSEGVLSHVKNESWGAMNSLTHSGMYQVVRRNKPNSICSNYTEEEILDALSTANSFALLTAVEIANLAKNDPLTLEFLDKSKEYYASAP